MTERCPYNDKECPKNERIEKQLAELKNWVMGIFGSVMLTIITIWVTGVMT